LADIRRAGQLDAAAEGRIGALIERFGEVESTDEALPDRKLMDTIQAEVERAIPAESLWLPRAERDRPADPGPDETRSPYPTSTPLPAPPLPPSSPSGPAPPAPQPAKP
jgi:hypothetical protein